MLFPKFALINEKVSSKKFIKIIIIESIGRTAQFQPIQGSLEQLRELTTRLEDVKLCDSDEFFSVPITWNVVKQFDVRLTIESCFAASNSRSHFTQKLYIIITATRAELKNVIAIYEEIEHRERANWSGKYLNYNPRLMTLRRLGE